MSRTRKPCPGCGTVDSWRGADKVCGDCQELIRIGREARSAPPPGDRCILPERAYAWPRYFASKDVRCLHDSPGASDLSEALAGFVWVCSKQDETPVKRVADGESKPPSFVSEGQYGWGRARVLPAGSLQHLVRLHEAIQTNLTEAARVAFKSGRNLLMSLNDGTISVDEFNKRDGGRG